MGQNPIKLLATTDLAVALLLDINHATVSRSSPSPSSLIPQSEINWGKNVNYFCAFLQMLLTRFPKRLRPIHELGLTVPTSLYQHKMLSLKSIC